MSSHIAISHVKQQGNKVLNSIYAPQIAVKIHNHCLVCLAVLALITLYILNSKQLQLPSFGVRSRSNQFGVVLYVPSQTAPRLLLRRDVPCFSQDRKAKNVPAGGLCMLVLNRQPEALKDWFVNSAIYGNTVPN